MHKSPRKGLDSYFLTSLDAKTDEPSKEQKDRTIPKAEEYGNNQIDPNLVLVKRV